MYIRKLKQSGGIGGYWIPLVTVIFFILFVTFLSVKVGIILVLLVFVMMSQYSFYAYYRTRNLTYLLSALFTSIYSGFLLFVPKAGVLSENKTIAFTCMFIAFAIGIAAFSQVLSGRFKWRGRDLFELIAQNVSTANNGFTSRPHPTGTLNYSKDEIEAFVNFMQSNLVGLAVRDGQKTFLVPVKRGYEPYMLFKPGNRLLESSWMAFQDDGQVSVHISKSDYLDFKEPLSFDELCVSYGALVEEFLEYFQRGEEIRIIDKLKSINTGVFN